MQVQTTDIIKRVERNKANTVWLSERLLLQLLDDLHEEYFRVAARPRYRQTVSEKKRTKDILPDTGKSWRYAKIYGEWYYSIANIPANYRSKIPAIDTLLAKAKKETRTTETTDIEPILTEALKERKNAFYRHFAGLKTEQADNLAAACAVAEKLIEEAEKQGKKLNNIAFLADAEAALTRMQIRYLPINWRKLGEKLRECAEKGVTEAIKLPRSGNKYALKFDDPELTGWMMQMRSMGQNFTGAHIARKIRLMCALCDKPVPSVRWFEAEFAKPSTKFLTAAGRFGDRGRKGQMFKGYVPVQNALFAGDAWQMDGTRENFIGWVNGEGKEEHLFKIVVRDVHSGDILGTHYDTKESRWGYLAALKMAVNQTGYLPYQLVLDRFPGHNTEEWKLVQARIERMGVKVDYKHTATGKAQLERWFETLQSVFAMDSEWYYGEGIMSGRDAAHRSSEYLMAQRKKRNAAGWDFDRAWKESAAVLDRYRSTKLSDYSRKFAAIEKSPKQLHDESEKPHVTRCDAWEYIALFGLEKEATIRGGMIKTEIRGLEYQYEVGEYEVVKNYRKVRIGYDLEDLNRVWLFEPEKSDTPRFLCEATEIRAVQMYGPKADFESLGKQKKRVADLKKRAADELEEKKAQASDVTLLLNGFAPKAELENAETAYLMEREGEWKDDKKPRITRAEKPIEEEETDGPLVNQSRDIAMMMAQSW